MVQIKYTAAALIVAAAIAPAFANINAENSISAREIDELSDFIARDYELEERDLSDDVEDLLARASQHLAERDYQGDDELLTREFDELFQRDVADLVERDPLFGFVRKFLSKKKTPTEDLEERDFEDVEVRDVNDELEARDFEEDIEAREFDEDIEAREFDEDLEARDFDEFDLEAREPIFGLKHAAKWIGKKFGKKPNPSYGDDQSEYEGREYDDLLERHYDELMERELASEAEMLERDLSPETEILERDFDEASVLERDFDESSLLERDFEGDELVTREPGIVDWFKNLFGGKKAAEKRKAEQKKKAEAKKAAEAAKKAAAEESDSEAREFYDDLD